MPVSTKAYEGMFSQLGIDTRTQEQILSERSSATVLANLNKDRGTERFAGQHALETSGAAIGKMIKDKFDKPKLKPEEQANVTALATAQEKFEANMESGLYDTDGKPDLLKQSEGFNRTVAAELIKIGDPKGAALAKSIDVDMRARRADEQQFVEGGLDIAKKTQDAEESIYDNEQKRFKDFRETIVDVWPQGSTDPNSTMSGYMNKDGVVQTAAGAQFPLGTYTTTRPKEPKLNPDGTSKAPKLSDIMSLKDTGTLRNSQKILFSQFGLAVGMKDAIMDSIGSNGTIEMMGTGGKITGGAIRLLDNIQSMGRTLGSFIQLEDADGEATEFDGTFGSASTYVKDNKALFDGIEIPEEVRQSGDVAVQRYQAILVQFAYGKAQLNEPGGRISDNDFKAAVKQIAGSATNPEALRQVMVGDLGRSVDAFRFGMQQLPQEYRSLVVDDEAMARFNTEYDNFEQSFDDPFGTAASPGQGILNPQGQPRDHLEPSRQAPTIDATAQAVIDGMQEEQAALEEELRLLQEQ